MTNVAMNDHCITLDTLVADYTRRERAWLPHDHRGRWVVIEPGAGHHMTGSPKEVRRIADLATPRRARRFSSLSRARAFARSVKGTVFRWRRTAPSGQGWAIESPWQRAMRSARGAATFSFLAKEATAP